MKKGEAGMLKELERDFIDKEEMERKGNREGKAAILCSEVDI